MFKVGDLVKFKYPETWSNGCFAQIVIVSDTSKSGWLGLIENNAPVYKDLVKDGLYLQPMLVVDYNQHLWGVVVTLDGTTVIIHESNVCLHRAADSDP